MIAYRLAGVQPGFDAIDHPLARRIRHGGPWQFVPHPEGGSLAIQADWPGKGQYGSKAAGDYGAPVDVGDGLFYLPSRTPLTIYDLARPEHVGIDVRLANGMTVSIPCAVVQHRQFRLSRAAKERLGDPVTEYGRAAVDLLAKARRDNALDENDPELWRLIELAFAQCYRVTAELLDDLGILARDDIDSILGAVWWGDPKALSPAPAGGPQDSPSSASPTPT